MASGRINGSVSKNSSGYEFYLTWSSKSNVSDNTSSVTATAYARAKSSAWASDTVNSNFTQKITINGKSSSKNVRVNIKRDTEPVKLFSYTTTVPHNSDGTKSITISANCKLGTASYSPGTGTASGTAKLDTIPRATMPKLSTSNLKMGNTLTISLPRADSSFTHTVTWKFGSKTGTISSSAGTSCTWTPGKELATQIPNSMSGTCTITVTTKKGSSTIGTKTATLTLTVADDTLPTVSLSVSEAVDKVSEQIGAYVKLQSKWKITVTGKGIQGSSIKSYKVAANGKTYTSASVTTGVLNTAGSNTITATVTDSRGKSKTVTQKVTVLDYASPAVTSLSAVRCLQDGTTNEDGEYTKVSFGWKIYECNQKNTKSCKVSYKQRTGSSWTDKTVALNTYSGSTSVILSGINVDYIYDIKVTVTDFFGSASRSSYVPTAFTLVDYRKGGKGIAFGKVAEEDGLDCNLSAFFRKPINFNGNQYFSQGNYASNFNNSDVIGFNGIYFNDSGDTDLEGLNFPKSGVSISGPDYVFKETDFYTLRIDANGELKKDGNLVPVYGEHIGKTLWSGSWKSGSITIPNLKKYRLFALFDSEKGTVILVPRTTSWFRGLGGYISDSENLWWYAINAEITNLENGTVKLIKQGGFMNKGTGGMQSWTTTSIVGIV